MANNSEAKIALLTALALGMVDVAATQQLRVCVAEKNAPLSYQAPGGEMRGLDVRIAEAAATSMQRKLVLVPFDSGHENESTLGREVNALLSSGICDAVSGFPLLRSDFTPDGGAKARTPDYPGAPRRRDRPFIPLQEMAATPAYQGVALAAAMRKPTAPWSTLAGLRSEHPDWKVGVVSGTMAGAVALLWRHGSLQRQLVTLKQDQQVLQALVDGKVDVGILPLAQFDGWLLANPASPVGLAAWRRSLGINIGFVTLASNVQVRGAITTAISDALSSGRMRQWAVEEGATWQAPTLPVISNGPGLSQLAADDQ